MTTSRSSGFTLIELMVVVLIIGVMATFVTLSIGSRSLDARMDAESHRIEELVKLALEEADLKGIPLGLSFGPEGYSFLAIDDKHHWSEYQGNELLRTRKLEEPFVAQLSVEGHAVGPPNAQADKVVPQVLLLPGGDSTPFILEIRAPGDRTYYHVEGDSQGHVRRETRQEERRR